MYSEKLKSTVQYQVGFLNRNVRNSGGVRHSSSPREDLLRVLNFPSTRCTKVIHSGARWDQKMLCGTTSPEGDSVRK